MKERPILFSGAMVRALLADAKTQTRRVVKMESHQQIEQRDDGRDWPWMYDGERDADYWMACPYGQPGDRLWVRETWQGPLLEEFEMDADADWHLPSHIHQYQNPAHCVYAADGGPAPEYTDIDDNMRNDWRPSIHMPRWASRITLEITSVHVERLQKIDIADAQAEGVSDTGAFILDGEGNEQGGPIAEYAVLWDQINGPGIWEENPWVWVVKFNRVIGGAP